MGDDRRGTAYGVACYLIWGLFPLFWPLLEPAGAVEILAHRVVWSLVFVLGVLAVQRNWSWLRPLLSDRASLTRLGLAAVLIAGNWCLYIWGVNNNHVVETSLGYFIMPVVTVLVGVLVLQERLRRLQWAAIGLGAFAVVVLAVDYGRPPWIALTLACSFGTYGLLKKRAAVGAVEGLVVETGLLAPLAVGYLLVLQAQQVGTFTTQGAPHTALLVGTGVITALPLLLFGAAAPRVRLTTIGLLQYVAPVLQFLLGLIVFDESMTAARWVGFGLIWAALAIVTVGGVMSARRSRLAGRDPVSESARGMV